MTTETLERRAIARDVDVLREAVESLARTLAGDSPGRVVTHVPGLAWEAIEAGGFAVLGRVLRRRPHGRGEVVIVECEPEDAAILGSVCEAMARSRHSEYILADALKTAASRLATT